MNFNLVKPCKECPFTITCLKGWLGANRAYDIAINGLLEQQATFTCHKTLGSKEEQHCAGALIILEKLNKPNQMMRWMERIGKYDHRKLIMDSNVFNSMEEFINHHTNDRK